MCSEVTTSAIGVLGSCRVSAFFCRSHKYIHIESQTEGETWKWWQLHFSFQWINVYLQFGSAYMFVCVWVCVVNLDKWEVIVSMTPMIAFKVILLVFRWMVLVLDVYHFDLDHLPYCMMAVCVCVCAPYWIGWWWVYSPNANVYGMIRSDGKSVHNSFRCLTGYVQPLMVVTGEWGGNFQWNCFASIISVTLDS